MKLDKSQVISVEVLLRSASGHKIGPQKRITADNLDLFVPQPDAYPVVLRILRSLEFEVGPLTGISFSITAAVSTFENIFKSPLRSSPKGGIETVMENSSLIRLRFLKKRAI